MLLMGCCASGALCLQEKGKGAFGTLPFFGYLLCVMFISLYRSSPQAQEQLLPQAAQEQLLLQAQEQPLLQA